MEPEERDWKRYTTLIGFAIQDTIPNTSEITTLDAVKLLVREVNVLRKAIGLPSYYDLAREEERRRD